MPRQARIVVPGCPHHVTQRGNQRRQMFCCAEDYRRYLSRLGELAPRYGVSLRGFCLMANHVHLLPVPVHGRCAGTPARIGASTLQPGAQSAGPAIRALLAEPVLLLSARCGVCRACLTLCRTQSGKNTGTGYVFLRSPCLNI